MSELNFTHSNGNKVKLTTPDTLAASKTFKLPNADGSAGEFLKTDGSGNLGFSALGSVGKLIKYTTFTHDGYVTGAYHGNPNDQSAGYQLINASYTPAAANSTIALFSSSLVIGEGVNHHNNFWLSAWEGSNFISAVSGSGRYTSFASNLNAATLNYIGTFSAGSTTARNIMFRCAANDAGNNSGITIYINGNPNGSYSGNQNRFTVFLAELAP
mgnify:FL=1